MCLHQAVSQRCTTPLTPTAECACGSMNGQRQHSVQTLRTTMNVLAYDAPHWERSGPIDDTEAVNHEDSRPCR